MHFLIIIFKSHIYDWICDQSPAPTTAFISQLLLWGFNFFFKLTGSPLTPVAFGHSMGFGGCGECSLIASAIKAWHSPPPSFHSPFSRLSAATADRLQILPWPGQATLNWQEKWWREKTVQGFTLPGFFFSSPLFFLVPLRGLPRQGKVCSCLQTHLRGGWKKSEIHGEGRASTRLCSQMQSDNTPPPNPRTSVQKPQGAGESQPAFKHKLKSL